MGASLLGPYLLGVELVSMLLLVGLIGAFHLAYRLGKGEASEEGEGRDDRARSPSSTA